MQESDIDSRVRAEIFGVAKTRAFFMLEPVKDVKASIDHGYPVYRLTPHVLVRAEGEKDGIALVATQEHKRKYPSEWAAFNERQSTKMTSLYVIPTINKAVTSSLHELGIHTVEQLATAEVFEPSPIELVISNDPNDMSEPEEEAPICKLPKPLEKWRSIAMRWISLRDSVESGEKPKLRVVNGQFQFLENGQ